MRVTESDLAPLRRPDAPLRIAPDFAAMPRRYADFPAGAGQISAIFAAPTILSARGIGFTATHEAFAGAWAKGRIAVPVLAFTDTVPPLPPAHHWDALEHQGGGYSCLQLAMIATRFTAKPSVQSAFNAIADDFHYALNGWFDDDQIDPDLTQSYRNRLAALGLKLGSDAQRWLCESVYPVDAAALAALTDDDPLLTFFKGCEVTPVVLFLAENSD